jgi:hypothetical protein
VTTGLSYRFWSQSDNSKKRLRALFCW